MNYKQQYCDQKYGAAKRGIDFMFTYAEWLDWWGDDIENRGRGKEKLVMSRYGDVGPYHPDNVFKNTLEQNSSEANLGRIHTEEARAKKRGKPRTDETRAKISAAMKAYREKKKELSNEN